MAYHDPNRKTKLIVDGSKYRLSSMLRQLDPETHQYRVIRNDSHSTTPSESHYAQIEIESAAVEFSTRRNHIYLYGLRHYIVSTDHKPLLLIYNSYRAEIPPCILKHKLQLQGYSFDAIYEPGKDNPTDNKLRHPLPHSTSNDKALRDIHKLQLYVDAVIRDDLPAAITLEQLKEATEEDPVLQQLMHAIQQGYISPHDKHHLLSFQPILSELTIINGLVLRGTKLFIPSTLRDKVVTLAHKGHQGIVRTKQLLRSTLWFPGMDRMVEKEIS